MLEPDARHHKAVDNNEPYDMRSRLLEVGWVQESLYAGDYHFLTINYKRVGIERKTVSDLISSLSNERLSDQLFRLVEHYDIKILLLEGKWGQVYDGSILTAHGVTQWKWDTVWNFIQTWQDRGVTIQMTTNSGMTIQRLNSLYAYYQKASHSGGINRTIVGDPRLLAFPSGIGERLGSAILKEFGSLKAVANAQTEDFLVVEKVGLKKAQAIFDFYNRAKEKNE